MVNMSKYKYDFTLDTAEKNFSLTGLASRVQPKQRVLELGCSYGYLSKFLKDELGCTVVGVDIDAEAIEQAASFCEQVIVANLDEGAWLAEIEGQKFDVISVVNELESRLEDIVDPIDVAVIGCVVNGPGEAKEVSVGLTGGSPNLLYINGQTHSKVENASLVDELEAQIRSQLKNA
mgnify:CR=1 FL=1